MANSSMMEFQHRPLAVGNPLGWARSDHLDVSVGTRRLNDQGGSLGPSVVRGIQITGKAFPGCAAVEPLAPQQPECGKLLLFLVGHWLVRILVARSWSSSQEYSFVL